MDLSSHTGRDRLCHRHRKRGRAGQTPYHLRGIWIPYTTKSGEIQYSWRQSSGHLVVVRKQGRISLEQPCEMLVATSTLTVQRCIKNRDAEQEVPKLQVVVSAESFKSSQAASGDGICGATAPLTPPSW